VNGQLHAPELNPLGKSPWYPVDRRLVGLQSQSGRGGEKKDSHPLPGLEPPIIQPVAQRCTTELSGLLNDLNVQVKVIVEIMPETFVYCV
jgi:hypothetical protein